jgi:hypothetical protein
MTAKPTALRIPEELLQLANFQSHEQRIDRASVLRQWMYQGAEVFALKMVSQRCLTIGRAAELLDKTHEDLYRIAASNEIELGATLDDYLISNRVTENQLTKERSAG